MNIIFSQHAKDRMAERKIDKDDIIFAIFMPDRRQLTYQNRIVVQKQLVRKTLEVIYFEKKTAIIVITCYFI